MILVEYNNDGIITGFDHVRKRSDTRLSGNIIEISESEYKQYTSAADHSRFGIDTDAKRFITNFTPPKIAPSPEVAAAMEARKEVDADAILTEIKTMTPNQAYNKVMSASTEQLRQITASIAKFIAWQYNQ